MYRRWLAGAAVALSLVACSAAPARTTGAARGPSTATVQVSLDGWATVRVPRDWHVTPTDQSTPAGYYPLTFIGSERLAADCRTAAERCPGTGSWFPPNWTTPDDGVITLWSHAEFPSGPPLKYVTGRLVTVDGRPAKISASPTTGGCPPGTAAETDVYVSASPHPERERFPSGERFDLTACFGARASRADRAAVTAMLDSLRIVRPR